MALKTFEQEHATATSEKREFDPSLFASNMAVAMREWQDLMAEMTTAQANENRAEPDVDFMHIGQAFAEMMTKLAMDPARLLDLQVDLFERWLGVWEHSMQRFLGHAEEAAPMPAKRDRRFADPAWSENIYFDFLRQSYLLGAKWLEELPKRLGGFDPQTLRKLDFYTRQFVDAMSPSNFLLTNPEALKATLESHGENLIRGFRNLRKDFAGGEGKLRITMTDETAFVLGETIASTKGKVVFRNDLIELIQYEPLTEKVHETPLLLIPAWINKFYIFDMQPQNSFVRWLSEQGYTVFVISWVNPDASHAEKNFDHYLEEGPLAALSAIEEITGTQQTAAIGYCLGGTLLSILLSWLKAKEQENRIASATYLTTMIDFAEPGELGVFIDEPQLASLESRMNARGYLDGREMSVTFNMLRANDLIWSFVVNNYLLGKEPFPFDLLYWNADATRMPAKMHSFYLRNMYLDNRLKNPGELTVGGMPVDLAKITTPTYILSTKDDHIAPWRSTFASTRIYSADITFTLAASGHIAGVINPPSREKYSFWTAHLEKETQSDQWLDIAEERLGSWWPHWEKWQAEKAGPMRNARNVVDRGLGDAPGSYVRHR